MWTCPSCGSDVEASFDVCWNCGTTREGVPDPAFVREDDAPPITTEQDPVVPTFGAAPTAVPTDLTTPITGDLAEAYQALDLMEARFLVDQLGEAGIRATCDTHDFHEALGSMQGGPKVYVRAEDLGPAHEWLATYERHKASTAGDE